jgi:hypothetical protein
VETLARFERPEEGHLLRMRLEAAGFEAFVQDEATVQLLVLYSNVIGGVRVQVPAEELQEAQDFLLTDTGIDDLEPSRKCPRCGWTGIERESFSRRIAYLTLMFLGFPIPVFRHRLRCNRCLLTWSPDGSSTQ